MAYTTSAKIGLEAGIVASVSSHMPAANSIRILLVDDQLMVREGLRLIIEGQPDLTVIGEAGNRTDAIEIARRECPDIILVDPTLDPDNDYAIIAELRAVAVHAQVITLTGTSSRETQRRAIDQGAKGALWKQEASATLIKAIKKVAAGEIWLQRSVTASLLLDVLASRRARDCEIARVAALTQREREVVNLVAEGLKNKQIAEKLFITDSTVSHHLTSIFGKLGLSDRLQLIVYAHRQGLTKPAA